MQTPPAHAMRPDASTKRTERGVSISTFMPMTAAGIRKSGKIRQSKDLVCNSGRAELYGKRCGFPSLAFVMDKRA
jgi:hypothetical protein